MIVIAEQAHAYANLDLPLLNRFEKQVLLAPDLCCHGASDERRTAFVRGAGGSPRCAASAASSAPKKPGRRSVAAAGGGGGGGGGGGDYFDADDFYRMDDSDTGLGACRWQLGAPRPFFSWFSRPPLSPLCLLGLPLFQIRKQVRIRR